MRPRRQPGKTFTHCAVSDVLFVLGAALVALALKWKSRDAAVQNLDWLLGPTTGLVQRLSGERFVFESGIGYISRDLGFIIAPECGGLNFLVAAFMTCVIGSLLRLRSLRSRLFFVALSAALAFGVTLFANTARILLAIAIHRHDVTLPWCSVADLHRIDGIVVFFGALCLLHLTLQVCVQGNEAGEGGRH